MRRNYSIIMFILCFMTVMSAVAAANEYTGLWLGEININAVSEVNQREPDMSFDLALTGIVAEDMLLSRGAQWKYEESGLMPDGDWTDEEFDDANWRSGAAPLGYGAGEETVVSYGDDPAQKNATVYFRKNFSIENPLQYKRIRVQVWRNDGVILYLNGEELLRDNVSYGYVDHNTFAESGEDGDGFIEVVIPAYLLEAGENILAAEVHIAAANDATMLFDMSLRGIYETSRKAQLVRDGAEGWQYAHVENGVENQGDLVWNDLGYDDKVHPWLTGQAPFGYGDGDEETKLVSDTVNIPAAGYFRKAFGIRDDPGLTHLRFELLYDDGAIVYLNGEEIFRMNMPEGEVTGDTYPIKALGAGEEHRYTALEIALADLPQLDVAPKDAETLAKNNVVAVAVYQHQAEMGGGDSEESDDSNETVLTNAPGGFEMRILLHVDDEDTVHLLKEAISMVDDNTGEPVIVANHLVIPEIMGRGVEGESKEAARVSAINFDFPGAAVQCGGVMGQQGTINCAFVLGSNHSTNPFLHRYHPDHDNLGARYIEESVEAFEVSRSIVISFSDRFPPDTSVAEWTSPPPPGWGDSILGGTYKEEINGLHKLAISVSGPVTLQRISNEGTLRK